MKNNALGKYGLRRCLVVALKLILVASITNINLIKDVHISCGATIDQLKVMFIDQGCERLLLTVVQ